MFMPMHALFLSIYNFLFLSELNIQWSSHFCHKNSKVKQYENNLGHKKYINKNQQLCIMWR